MMRNKMTATLATTALLSGMLTAAAAPASAAPAGGAGEARLDTGAQICATLPTARTRADCYAQIATGRKPTAAEVRCVKGAGISVAGVIAGQRISREPARALMYRVVIAGVLGCVGGLIA